MKTLKEQYKEKIAPELQKIFGYTNVFAIPKMQKVTVNVGIGRITDRNEREAIKKVITQITGQVPQERTTNKNIATFKIRRGALVGYRVTLRGKRMFLFVDKLVRATLPRTRDFRGIKRSCVDQSGNMNLGIKEHIIFPELIGEDINRIHSFQINITATTKTHEEGIKLFELVGFPFEKVEEEN